MKYSLIFLSILIFSACSSKQLSSKDKKAQLYYQQGSTHLSNGKYPEALNNLLKANDLSPNKDEILATLGLAYYYRGSQTKAVEYLKKSIQLAPKETEYKNNLATILLELNRLNEAERIYKDVVSDLSYKSSYLAYYNLGILEEKRKKPLIAYQYFSKSSKEKKYCMAYYKLGLYDYQNNKLKSAVSNFKNSVLGQCFRNPEHHYLLGLSYFKNNQKDLAKMKFKEVIQNYPSSQQSSLALKQMAAF